MTEAHEMRGPFYGAGFLAIIAVLLAIACGIMFAAVTYKPKPVVALSEKVVETNFLCYECHTEELTITGEEVNHTLPPPGVDHMVHLYAAVKMAKGRLGVMPKHYPYCYACHLKFSAEEGLEPWRTLAVCGQCHNVNTTRLHDKLPEFMAEHPELGCTTCHSDWDGKEHTVTGMEFLRTQEMCRACHGVDGIPMYHLAEVHRIHGVACDCKVCHDIEHAKTHEDMARTRIEWYSQLQAACLKCHTGTALHGAHYAAYSEKDKPLQCHVCHLGGIGAPSFETKPVYQRETCLKCHDMRETAFHEKMAEKMMEHPMCLMCHGKWIGKWHPYPHGVSCNVCHPASFTLERSVALHRTHLMLGYGCQVCHNINTDTHAAWIGSAGKPEVCWKCHSPAKGNLPSDHIAMWNAMGPLNCLQCHRQWQWPKPTIFWEVGHPGIPVLPNMWNLTLTLSG